MEDATKLLEIINKTTKHRYCASTGRLVRFGPYANIETHSQIERPRPQPWRYRLDSREEGELRQRRYWEREEDNR